MAAVRGVKRPARFGFQEHIQRAREISFACFELRLSQPFFCGALPQVRGERSTRGIDRPQHENHQHRKQRDQEHCLEVALK